MQGERRPADTGLNPGRPGNGIHIQHAVHPVEVHHVAMLQRDRTAVAEEDFARGVRGSHCRTAQRTRPTSC